MNGFCSSTNNTVHPSTKHSYSFCEALSFTSLLVQPRAQNCRRHYNLLLYTQDSHTGLTHRTHTQDSHTGLTHRTHTQDSHTGLTHRTHTLHGTKKKQNCECPPSQVLLSMLYWLQVVRSAQEWMQQWSLSRSC